MPTGPGGLPQGSREEPDRSLASRLQPGKKKDIQSGIFKALRLISCAFGVHFESIWIHFGSLAARRTPSA